MSKPRDKRTAGGQAVHEDPIAEQPFCKIPPGQYDAVCYKTEVGTRWERRSLYIWFRIQGTEYHDTAIFMVCPFPKGRIRNTRKFANQWTLANGAGVVPNQRMSREVFTRKLFRILVRDTQRKFSNGDLMPSILQYSVVDTILERLTGGGEV